MTESCQFALDSPVTPARVVVGQLEDELLDCGVGGWPSLGTSAYIERRLPNNTENRFTGTYSGIELKHVDHLMVVYRLPDPALDEFVRTHVLDVTVDIRDARLSLARMRETTNQVMRDQDYWRGQGITINGAGPTPDGSSVEVLAAPGNQDEQRALSARYGEGAISVRQENPAPPTLNVPTDAPTLIAPTAAPYTPPSPAMTLRSPTMPCVHLHGDSDRMARFTAVLTPSIA